MCLSRCGRILPALSLVVVFAFNFTAGTDAWKLWALCDSCLVQLCNFVMVRTFVIINGSHERFMCGTAVAVEYFVDVVFCDHLRFP